jgi:Flp pilus assembly pilin Flp
MLTKFRELVRYVSGTATLQFALGIGAIGFVVIASAVLFGSQLDGTFSGLSTSLQGMFVR